MSAAQTLHFPFRDDPDFVDLVTHRLADDRVEVEIAVADMRCANCAGRIELSLNALDGVARVRTNPAQRRLVLEYDPNRVGLRSIFQSIEDAGYTASYVAQENDDDHSRAQRRRQLKGLAVAALAMMQVMMFSLPLYVADADGMSAYYAALFRWSALLFTTPVVFYSARPFFTNAVASFRGAFGERGAPGLAMDVPVAIAVGTAYAASVASTHRR